MLKQKQIKSYIWSLEELDWIRLKGNASQKFNSRDRSINIFEIWFSFSKKKICSQLHDTISL